MDVMRSPQTKWDRLPTVSAEFFAGRPKDKLAYSAIESCSHYVRGLSQCVPFSSVISLVFYSHHPILKYLVLGECPAYK